MKYLNNQNKEKGVALLLAVIIMVILLAIGLGISAILLGQFRVIKGMGDSVMAIFAADTAAERILYMDRMCYLPGCEELAWPCLSGCGGLSGHTISGVIGGATYEADFEDHAMEIKAVGIYQGKRRAIEITR